MLHEGGKTGGSRLPRSAVAEPIGNAEALSQFSVKAHPVPRTACIGCGYWGKKVARNLASLNALHAVAELLALPDPPTAIFPSQNLLTIGGIQALRSADSER